MMAGRYQVKQEENGINFQVMPRQFAFNHEVVSRQVGTKPFQCAICNATFEETNSLKLHFTAVHERGIVRGGPAPGVLVNQRPPVVHQRPPTVKRQMISLMKIFKGVKNDSKKSDIIYA